VNEHITVYRNGVLVAGVEPAVTPVVTKVKVFTENRNKKTDTNSLNTYLKIVNEGNVPLNYGDLTARYWFTADGTSSLSYWMDYAELGTSSVKGQFVTVSPSVATADRYFELKVDSALGMLYPLSNTGNIQYRVAKSDWSGFNETNDHSYLPAAPLAENNHVTVYYKGQLIYGTEPAGDSVAGARTATAVNAALAETAVSKIMIYPNPVSGNRFYIKLNNEWQNETVHVKIYSMYGTVVMQKVFSAGRGGVLEINFNKNLAAGVYMVQLNDRQAGKLVIER
jgi:hypothetical protein